MDGAISASTFFRKEQNDRGNILGLRCWRPWLDTETNVFSETCYCDPFSIYRITFITLFLFCVFVQLYFI